MNFNMNVRSFSPTNAKCKLFYSFLLSKKADLPMKSTKLKTEFNLSENELKETYQVLFDITPETYLRSFQYKIKKS